MDVEAAIQQLEQLFAEARPVPLSASIMVNKAEVDEAIAALRAALPEEIRQSRWVLKERDDLLGQAARESDQIVAEARAERQRMLSEAEVVRAANREAERIIEQAHAEAHALQLDADDYIDGKLASFEIVLQKTMRAVEKGRESLRGRLMSGEFPTSGAGPDQAVSGPRPAQFYDHEVG